MKKIKMYMGLPSIGTRHDAQCYLLREVEERYSSRIDFVYPDICVYRSFHDFARNAIVDEFLASDCDVLWFLDSDVVPPKHVLDLITDHWDTWEAAGAPYPIWMVPPGGSEACVIFTAYDGIVDNDVTKGITMTEVPRAGTAMIDGLATGCLFLKRSVFEKLQKPYFEFKYDLETRRMKEGEDLGFCLKANKAGIKFFTDYSMVCKHYKTVCLLDINNYATSMSNYKILEYDKEIRTKVQNAVLAAEEAGYQRALKTISKTKKTTNTGLILPNNL